VIFTHSFMLATLERAIKTFAQALLAFIPAAGTGAIPDLNWGDMLTLSGYAALASVLFSIGSSGVGGPGPSLANEVISPPAVDPEHGYSIIELAVGVLVLVILVLVILRLA